MLRRCLLLVICGWCGAVESAAQTVAAAPPESLVFVQQTIDLRQQLSVDDNIMTLDGEPAPPMITRNVTLGLAIDTSGHIVTRLVGVSPNQPPLDVYIIPQRGLPLPARFLGIDAVTGFCVLEVVSGAPPPPSRVARAEAVGRQTVQLYGFDPAQSQGSPTIVTLRPRIHVSSGRMVKALGDFRYEASNPIYRLQQPRLTAPQDGSLVVNRAGAIFGVAVYDTTLEGQNIVYPIGRIERIARDVITSQGSLAHGWLGATGVTMYAPIPTNARTPATPFEQGVRVTGIIPDSPAEEAGVKVHDILLSINERQVASVEQLSSALRRLAAGSAVTLRVKRGNAYHALHAKLVPAPALESGHQLVALAGRLQAWEDELRMLPEAAPQRRELEPKVTAMRAIMSGILGPAPSEVKLRVLYGLEVQPLKAQLLRHFAVPGGVLVSTVSAGSRAARAGLAAGDVIVEVGAQPVTDLASLLKALDAKTDGSTTLIISRRRERQQITLSQ